MLLWKYVDEISSQRRHAGRVPPPPGFGETRLGNTSQFLRVYLVHGIPTHP